MAGYIINPFSSDFNPTTSVSYSAEPIPIVAYGLIGLTTLTLAYVTLVASKQESTQPSISSPTTSATSMLPSIFSPKPSQPTSIFSPKTPPSPSMIVSPFGMGSKIPEQSSQRPTVGGQFLKGTTTKSSGRRPVDFGKTRNKKHKHKKTKRSHH